MMQTTTTSASKGYNTISLHKVRGRDNHKWSRWRRGCVTEVPSLWGKYVSVGAVWRHNAPHEATRATVFSLRPHTMRDAVIPLVVPLKAVTRPLQTRLGLSPQPNRRLPVNQGASPQWNVAPRWPQPSRVLKHPRVTRSARISGGMKFLLVEV